MIKSHHRIYGDGSIPLPLKLRDTGYMQRVGESLNEIYCKSVMMNRKTYEWLPETYEAPQVDIIALQGGNILESVSLEGEVEDFVDSEDF